MTRLLRRLGAPVVLAIAGTLVLCACGQRPQTAETEGHAAKAGDFERGPHRGRMLRNGDFALEVTLFEDGVEPEFHVYAYRKDKPIPPKDVQLSITLSRLDGEVNRFAFTPVSDYLRGGGIVQEPHSFDVKVAATEFIWYAVNRVFQLVGGLAYMKDQPYEKLLRDLRIFPIFEGANDVMRCFIALTGLKPLADELKDLASVELNDPIRSIGVVAEYLRGRITRGLRPDSIKMAHPKVAALADPIAGQVKGLRTAAEGMLRKHGKKVQDRQWQQRRLAHAAMDIFAQIATVSRASAEGDKLSSREHHVAETFCTRAARRVEGNFKTIDNNDDARMAKIAPEAYGVGGYEFPLYD